jgi:hypothetical protein
MKDPELATPGDPAVEAEASDDIVITLTLKLAAETPDGLEYDIKADSDQLRDGDEEALLHVLETLVANIKGSRATQEPS